MINVKSTEETSGNTIKANVVSDEKIGKMDLSIDIPNKEYVICKVCGHKNKPDTGICEMCSNYLFI